MLIPAVQAAVSVEDVHQQLVHRTRTSPSVLIGKDGHLMKTYTCRTPGDTFGFDAVTLGDVDGDGDSDFLITSGWSGVHGFHSGRVFIIASGIKPH